MRAAAQQASAVKRAIENERKRLEECSGRNLLISMKKNLIKLNVGGVEYWTTRQTLLRIPGTFFEEAFQEDFEELKLSDGSIFIDRAGD